MRYTGKRRTTCLTDRQTVYAMTVRMTDVLKAARVLSYIRSMNATICSECSDSGGIRYLGRRMPIMKEGNRSEVHREYMRLSEHKGQFYTQEGAGYD